MTNETPTTAAISTCELCRCGASVKVDPHPCHARTYECRKPAAHRFYNPRAVALSGMQMKLQVMDTWACDECWTGFLELLGEK